jgi:hypothetical protein
MGALIQDKLADWPSVVIWGSDSVESQFCTGVCEEGTWASETEESPLLEAVTRKRLVKTLQAGEDLACSDL